MTMARNKLMPADDVLARRLTSKDFAGEWDRTALARGVAVAVVRYRVEHGLSQAALAKRLGVSQPVVARLEGGEHTPTWETLSRLAREMNVHFVVDVDPTEGAQLREVG
jgi:ribosome-binding protein aMBF1 (putative translation factor)